MKIGTMIRHKEAWGIETYVYKGLMEGEYDTHFFESLDGIETFTCDTATLPLLEIVKKEPTYIKCPMSGEMLHRDVVKISKIIGKHYDNEHSWPIFIFLVIAFVLFIL